MCRTLCQLNDQIIRIKQTKYRLEENWSNKDQSYKIEALNLKLNIQSPIIMPDVAALKNSEKYSYHLYIFCLQGFYNP